MLARKDKIVDTFTGGIALLFRKNKVASLHGHGRFVAGGRGLPHRGQGRGAHATRSRRST